MKTRINFRLNDILALFKENPNESLESNQETSLDNSKINQQGVKFQTFFDSQQSILKNYKGGKDVEEERVFPKKGILKTQKSSYHSKRQISIQDHELQMERKMAMSVRFDKDVLNFERKHRLYKRSLIKSKIFTSRLIIIKSNKFFEITSNQ